MQSKCFWTTSAFFHVYGTSNKSIEKYALFIYNHTMKIFLLPFFLLTGTLLIAQESYYQIAPDATRQLDALLNKPALVQPVKATPLGRNWFRLESDSHIITDEVSVKQVAAVLIDVGNQARYFNGQKSSQTSSIVRWEADTAIVDFITTSAAPLGIKIRTPYRASVVTLENTEQKFATEARQLEQDSANNKEIKNLLAARYAQQIAINGKTYTYIRIYTIEDVNASILPGARGVLENNAGPINSETLQLLISAAKNK
jgi:hypothetical protein